MPIALTPRPQPGDLITASWNDTLATNIEELQRQVTELSKRLAVLESGSGRRPPVKYNPRLEVFIKDLRGPGKILEVGNLAERLEVAHGKYLEKRQDFVEGDEVLSRELTATEWVKVGAAAGIAPSELPRVMTTVFPTAAQGVEAELGGKLSGLDDFRDVTSGLIGFR